MPTCPHEIDAAPCAAVDQSDWDQCLRSAVAELAVNAGPLSRLRARYRRWQAREAVYVPPFNATCAVCESPVVAAPTFNRSVWSPMYAPRPQQELVACCGEHGRAPFNTETTRRRMLESQQDYVFTRRRR